MARRNFLMQNQHLNALDSCIYINPEQELNNYQGAFFASHIMNSMKLVIPLHSLHWSIHTKDESKCRNTFAFIFGVNRLWRCGVTASSGVFFREIKRNSMTSFMEFMIASYLKLFWLQMVTVGNWTVWL